MRAESPVLVVHYHELWLKGRNRNFFLSKLKTALRQSLESIPVVRFRLPAHRIVIELGEGASLAEAQERLARVFGIAFYAVARPAERSLEAIARRSWEEVAPLEFHTFAVRAKRSDKSFSHTAAEIERYVGRFLLDRLRADGRDARVHLDDPELTCRIEIPPGPALIYARKIPGAGGLPANTAGRLVCLLSGGFDSPVAAYKMMKRGAHLSFVHFFGAGAQPGESSVHVARQLVRRLAAWQFTARLWRVPFEPIQREIVRFAPESFRILLYRRLMLRIAEQLAGRERAAGLVTGDSLGQVASQTLANMAAVGAAARLPLYRPLVGEDKLDILKIARQIGTYDISAEPFHDCCPVFMPRTPSLHASIEELDAAEAKLDITALVRQGVEAAALERFRYAAGRVERVESFAPAATSAGARSASA